MLLSRPEGRPLQGGFWDGSTTGVGENWYGHAIGEEEGGQLG